MLTLLAKLFNALNSENSIRQIALAMTLGLMVGLGPIVTLPNALLIFLALMIRVHLGAFLLAMGFFSGLGYLCSSLITQVGDAVLTYPSLNGLFTSLYQFNLFKLAHLHQTYTLGALVVGLLVAVPFYFTIKFLIAKYRVAMQAFVERFRIIKLLKGSRFYQIYLDISQ